MQFFKQPLSFFLFLAITLTLGMVSCSDDDNKDGGPAGPAGDEFGSSALTLSGDVEGERSGMADFELLNLAGLSHWWTISMLDFSPQTFSLNLILSVNSENAPQPGPGTYPIGIDINNPNTQYFTADLTLIENQDFANASNYTTAMTSGGTVTITAANDQEMVGTFEFTAIEYGDSLNVISTVDVSGSFSAVPVQ
ncbi:hypothetical protein G3O08_19490 [Cryomorpha ignava]|uniref:CHRD domain-containing protein n=1 Tax=Cryomorpha ignava TaxID=101383 RepID=A0A7K3WVI9_9FLAO|nr:hypothetical protein [Cryomorpha ignava]NEN25680.1 hypothetical protein [Cryomorpha ignava]